jgi:hypothetical protein
MIEALERRARELHARWLVRSWDYRQRDHARGDWFRLRRVLVEAAAAFVIPPEELAALVAEGYRLEPAGQALVPAKSIVFAPAERVVRIVSAREVPVRLCAELLEAQHMVLTPIDPSP